MKRRCPTPLATLLAALAFGLAASPWAARGAAITANYKLTSSASLPTPDANITEPQVVALILPPGSVVPPKNADGSEGSPLTILPDSQGFDASHLVVALKDTKSATGQPEQMLGLVFYGQGLQSGGVLHFALSIADSLANNPPTLQPLTAGISISADPIVSAPNGSTGGDAGGSGTTPPVLVPEPLSMCVWAGIAGIAFLRANRLRRTRDGAAASSC